MPERKPRVIMDSINPSQCPSDKILLHVSKSMAMHMRSVQEIFVHVRDVATYHFTTTKWGDSPVS